MINPLQAMQNARASNQNRASAIQGQGAANQAQNLQRQQLNVGSIGSRIDGQAPQMIQVDPNFYADKQQQRDYNILDAERGRQASLALSDRQNQQALALNELQNKQAIEREKLRAKNNRDNILEAERRANLQAEKTRKDQLEQARVKQALLNDQFEGLRAPAATSIQRYNAWNQGQAENYQQNAYKQIIEAQAYALGDVAIQKRWADNQNQKLGANQSRFDPSVRNIERDNPAYLSTAMELLQENEKFSEIQTAAMREAQQKTFAVGKAINDSYRATIDSVTKLGYSPNFDPNFTPTFPLSIDKDSGLLVPPANANVTPPPKIDDGSGNTSLTAQAIDAIGNAINRGVEISNDNAGTIGGTAVGAALLNAGTKQDVNKVDNLIKGAEIPKGSINNRKPISEAPLNELEKQKIEAFKKVAKATGSKVPKDIDILKMSSSQIKDHIMDTRKTLLGRITKRIGSSSRAGKLLSTAMKGAGIIGAGVLTADLINALSPKEKKELEETVDSTNKLVEIQNKQSDQGQVIVDSVVQNWKRVP